MNATEILTRAGARKLLPTWLNTAEIRDQIGAEIRARSVFVARGTNVQFLAGLAHILDDYLAGTINDATARLRMLRQLQSLGYNPEAGGFPGQPIDKPAERGTIEDLSSPGRMQLILDTQAELMFGAGQKAAGEEPQRAFSYPCWELIRTAQREVPRGMKQLSTGQLVSVAGEDWPSRWGRAGGELVDDRMVARKGATIWEELGSAAIFDDALDTDHPPFAFNSGMGWRAVPRAECIALGIITEDYKPEGFRAWRINEDAKIGAKNIPPDLMKAALASINARLEDGKLRLVDSLAKRRAAYGSHPAKGAQ
jgi:hypothetical protein